MSQKEVAVVKESAIQKSTAPDELIRLALSQGANLTELEKLLALKERYDATEARKAYHVAISAFKAVPLKIEKDKKVRFKAGGNEVGYNHASLANVTEKITKALSEFGLSASWRTKQEGEMIMVTCKITHVLGHSEETTLGAKADNSGAKNSIQAIGSTITYLERYTLLASLGLATFDLPDDDGRGSETEYIDETQIATIKEYLTSTNSDPEKFLKYAKVESLDMIPKAHFQKVMNALKLKEKAK